MSSAGGGVRKCIPTRPDASLNDPEHLVRMRASHWALSLNPDDLVLAKHRSEKPYRRTSEIVLLFLLPGVRLPFHRTYIR